MPPRHALRWLKVFAIPAIPPLGCLQPARFAARTTRGTISPTKKIRLSARGGVFRARRGSPANWHLLALGLVCVGGWYGDDQRQR
jgi:hypothetical protein